jgi:hypothetical protein
MRFKSHTRLMMMQTGWINRHQQDMIEYLKAKNKILREKLRKTSIGLLVPARSSARSGLAGC